MTDPTTEEASLPAPAEAQPPRTISPLMLGLLLRREALKATYRAERSPKGNAEHFRMYFDALRGALTCEAAATPKG